MNVTIVRDEHGSHVEPPLGRWWPKFEKLQWKAAATVAANPGLVIEVRVSRYSVNGVQQRGFYDIATPGLIVAGPFAFEGAWSYINGIAHGFQVASGVGASTEGTGDSE